MSDSSPCQVALGCLELVSDETKNEAVLMIKLTGSEYLTLPELNVEGTTGV